MKKPDYYDALNNLVSMTLLEGPKHRQDINKHVKVRMALLGHKDTYGLLNTHISGTLNSLLNKQLVVRKFPKGPNKLSTYQLRDDYAKTLKDEIQR